jgi:hypothetical protein
MHSIFFVGEASDCSQKGCPANDEDRNGCEPRLGGMLQNSFDQIKAVGVKDYG